MGQRPARAEPVVHVVAQRERVGAVGLFDRAGRSYEAVQDLIHARFPCERIEFLVYAGHEAGTPEFQGVGRSVPYRVAGPGPAHVAGEEVSGAAAWKRVIDMVRTGNCTGGTAVEYADAVLRGGSLLVVHVDEMHVPQVEAIFDRHDRINDTSWNWAWEHGGLFGRFDPDPGRIDDPSMSAAVPLRGVGRCVWGHAVLAGRATHERDAYSDEGDEARDEEEDIRFPSPEPEPPAEFPEEPERPPRDLN